jgi:hypothetical protein
MSQRAETPERRGAKPLAMFEWPFLQPPAETEVALIHKAQAKVKERRQNSHLRKLHVQISGNRRPPPWANSAA